MAEFIPLQTLFAPQTTKRMPIVSQILRLCTQKDSFSLNVRKKGKNNGSKQEEKKISETPGENYNKFDQKIQAMPKEKKKAHEDL